MTSTARLRPRGDAIGKVARADRVVLRMRRLDRAREREHVAVERVVVRRRDGVELVAARDGRFTPVLQHAPRIAGRQRLIGEPVDAPLERRSTAGNRRARRRLRDDRGLPGSGKRGRGIRMDVYPHQFCRADVHPGTRDPAGQSQTCSSRARVLQGEARCAAGAGAAVRHRASTTARSACFRPSTPPDGRDSGQADCHLRARHAAPGVPFRHSAAS